MFCRPQETAEYVRLIFQEYSTDRSVLTERRFYLNLAILLTNLPWITDYFVRGMISGILLLPFEFIIMKG